MTVCAKSATITRVSDPALTMTAGRTMRVAPLFGLEALLARFGVGLAPLLAESGLPADCLHDPETRLPVDRLLDLTAR